MRPLKPLLRKAASEVSIDTYQRLMAHAVLRTAFKELSSAPLINRRQQLWTECVGKWIGRDTPMTFVEFGVHQGYSINYFSNLNTSPQSVFIGLDSFEGLPEGWGGVPKGYGDVGGRIPQTKDPRVRFIKGWFQDTWDVLSADLTDPRNLVVHYDADLYSSTLFALSKIDTLKTEYLAIFDEFKGHECRALYNYIQSYNASVAFLGQTREDPCQVMCSIRPRIGRQSQPPVITTMLITSINGRGGGGDLQSADPRARTA